jgi:hypothetical protein
MAVNNLNTPGVGIQPSLIDAKGDLLVGTANDAIDRLGVTGTTGAVLTADAGETTGLKWAAAGSVGGLVHIETANFSGAVSHSFGSDADPIFTSAYRNYKIIFDNLQAASGTPNIQFRVRANTTDLTGSVYNRQRFTADGSSAIASRGINQTGFEIGNVGSAADQKSGIVLEVLNPQLTNHTQFITFNHYGSSSTAPIINNDYGSVQNNLQYNGFTIFSSSGNISGTLSVYGYKI